MNTNGVRANAWPLIADSLGWYLPALVFAACLTLIAWLLCRRFPGACAEVAARWRLLAGKTPLLILLVALLPVAVRLAAVWWAPPPSPVIHDDFSHLLAADTLAAGRFANPPHALSRHLDSIHVLQRPTYSSVYPIGQGLILAVGQVLLGSAWAGVLLSAALMSAATVWALLGLVPAPWAALGGVIAGFNYGVATYWMDSYRGGAFAAFGGALLFGALCRLRESPRPALGAVAGLGWGVVWLVRPFESVLLLALAWGAILAFAFRGSRSWREWGGTAALVLVCQLAAVSVSALHNRAVTGSCTVMPYHLNQRYNGVPQTFAGIPPIAPPAFRFAESASLYWFERGLKDQVERAPALQLARVPFYVWGFFATPWYTLPLLALLLQCQDREVAAGGAVLFAAMGYSALYPFFFPHYLAPYAAVMAFLIVRGMMELHCWRFAGRAPVRWAVLFLVTGGLASAVLAGPVRRALGRPASGLTVVQAGWDTSAPRVRLRTRVWEHLAALGGRHVVFVRYSPNHSFHDEWVYNAADVDSSRIVWCRSLGPAEDREAARYYESRRKWLVTVGGGAARLQSYDPEQAPGAAAGAPEWTWRHTAAAPR